MSPEPGTNLKGVPVAPAFTSIESDANSIYHALQLSSTSDFLAGCSLRRLIPGHMIDEVSDVFDLAGTLSLPTSLTSAVSVERQLRCAPSICLRRRMDLPFKENVILVGGSLRHRTFRRVSRSRSLAVVMQTSTVT
jgi:hypothetical protein